MSRNKDNQPEEPGNINLKEVAVVQGPVEAEIIRSLLDSAGIPCLMRGLVVQSVHAFSADGLGKIRILVPEEYLEAARGMVEQPPSKD